jgi:UvrD-like helicase C-terminal domain
VVQPGRHNTLFPLSLFADRLLDNTGIRRRLDGLVEPPRWLPQVRAALESGERCHGKLRWTADELTALVGRKQANHRAYASQRSGGIPVMSIHQAKNRQFEHVVLLWPPGVPGTDNLKAQLLYNGITRAQLSCRVFVRTEASFNAPPFAFPT